MLAEPDAVVTRILAKLGVVERIRHDLIAVMDAPDYPTAEPHPMSIADCELLHSRERDQALRMRASKRPGTKNRVTSRKVATCRGSTSGCGGSTLATDLGG
jgi:hypothetical protein